MLGGPPGGSGGFTRHLRRCMGRQRKLPCFPFKLLRGIKHALNDPADLAAKILHELIELRPAPVCRELFVRRTFDLKLATLDTVALENADGPGDCADFVLPLGVLDCSSALP